MHRVILKLCVLALTILAAAPGQVLALGDKPLVKINTEQYQPEDFKNWWQNWQERNQPVPETMDPFIDWQLLAKEAERMELYREPAYQQKISVFLRVRSLMQLKFDEVDAKIDLNENILRQEYEKSYAPRQRLQMYFFKDKELAIAAYDKISKGVLSAATLEELAPEKGGPSHYQETWTRPVTPPPAAWTKALASLQTEEISAPLAWHNNTVLVRKDGPPQKGDDEDFNALKREIGQSLWKKEKARLTADLIKNLYQKYNVQIDKDLLSKIPIGDAQLPEDIAEKPVLSTNYRNISARQFAEKLATEQGFRKKYGFRKEEADEIKLRLINGIISQTLTSWEAMARHYENKPPLQAVYNFYRKHRLIKELEKRLFKPKAVTTEEISAYYQEHIEEFRQPGTVTIVSVSGDEATAKKLWAGVLLGEDFFELANKYYQIKPKPQQMPTNHLDAEMAQAISSLAPGEVSSPFQQQGRTVIAKLVNRKASSHLPLSRVGDKIAQELRGKEFARLRAEYIHKLKDKSSISVDNKAWQALKKNLVVKK
ncbi:MAG: peptidylprolyl isomerase [Desulfobulbaceae bacterium]|nr:peptidylprolyl isomerase [Desulfobulbaceae bacterium]